jgi:predicted tellurium resistance membrane protein TerC
MREKLKPCKFLIIGMLVITALLRGTAMDIASGVLFGAYFVYSAVKYSRKKRNSKGSAYKIILEPRLNKHLKKSKKLRAVFGKTGKILLGIVLLIFYGIFLLCSGIKLFLNKRKAKKKKGRAVTKFKRSDILHCARIFGFRRMIENAVNKIIR